MKKYYRVFISSVSEGFKSERRRIIDSLMSEDRYFPVAMEHMTAASDTCLNLFTHMRNSDIYLLLFGTNYGSFVGNGSESLKKGYGYIYAKCECKFDGIFNIYGN